VKFTIPGGGGFIGSNLIRHLRNLGHACESPARDAKPIRGANLGHVVYCIGLTADFRSRWRDTARAHVELLAEFLSEADFESFLYLSSTRVYSRSAVGEEHAPLRVAPLDPSDLYNLTKLAGESLCFSSGRSNVRVARLSNVYGSDLDSENFLPSLIRSAVDHGKILLRTAQDSAKDYVSVEDVIALAPRIAISGRERLYNVASGRAISNRTLVDRLQELTGCAVDMDPAGQSIEFPQIDTSRIRAEFAFQPRDLLSDLPALVDQYRAAPHDKD
jgi:nucleoside-diphosphate-sugar epimerase